MSELIKPTATSRLVAARLRFGEGDIAGAADEAAALCRERPDMVSALALYARCAMRAQDWQAAADRWRRCLAANPPQGMAKVAVQGLAKALTELDQFTEAEVLWESVRAANPADTAGIAGLAAVAARRGDAAAAADLWRLAIATAAEDEPAWQLGLARAQAACGDATAAIVTIQDLLRQNPAFRPALGFLCQMLVLQNRREVAMAELAGGVFAGGPASVSERLRLLLWLEHMDDARAVFERAFAVADKVEDFAALFPHIPRLYEPAERLRLWQAIYLRVVDQPGPTATLLTMRLALASRDYEGFLRLHDRRPPLPPPWQEPLARAADTLRRPGFPDPRAHKIFVIGLSKTATTSVHMALGQLGYLSAHFDNGFSHAMLTMADAALFDSMSDIPVSAQFEALHDAYPNARFIYTTRTMVSWLPSFADHYRRWHGSDDFAILRAQCLHPEQCRNGSGLAEIHLGLYFRYADAGSAWRAYDARVAGFFAGEPAGKLLRLNLFSGDGWPELCGFLGKPVPRTPFPWENRRPVAP